MSAAENDCVRFHDRNLGVHDIMLDRIRLNPLNERKSWTLDGLVDLIDSLKRTNGNITPGVVELISPQGRRLTPKRLSGMLDDPESKLEFMVLEGNRRYLSLNVLRQGSMRARVLYNLTDEERVLVQYITNSTKVKIPPYQIGNSVWELYLYWIWLNNVNNSDGTEKYRFSDYWSIPAWVANKPPVRQFSRAIHKSEAMVWTAFYFQRVHRSIKKQVEDSKVPYTVAAEFGRIEDKTEQLALFARESRSSGRLGSSHARKAVSEHLRKEKPVPELAGAFYHINCFKGLSKGLNGLYRALNLACFLADAASDHQIFKEDLERCGLFRHYAPLKRRIGKLCSLYAGDEKYLAAKKHAAVKRNNRVSLVDEVVSGARHLNSPESKIKGLDLSLAEYFPSVRLIDIVASEKQPRKTFDKGEFCRLVETVKSVGILQPVLLRLAEAGQGHLYEIVAGETRYWAAAEVGLKTIDAVIIDIDDITARLVQIEEDLYEKVLLVERAESLSRLWDKRQKARGEGYTRAEFVKELNIGSRIVAEALQFASLDTRVKGMYQEGLINWKTAVFLENVKDEAERFRHAVAAAVYGLDIDRLKRSVYEQEHQLLLFSHKDLYKKKELHRDRLLGLYCDAFDSLGKKAGVLHKKAVLFGGRLHRARAVPENDGKGMQEYPAVDLLENLYERSHFIRLVEISDLMGMIAEKNIMAGQDGMTPPKSQNNLYKPPAISSSTAAGWGS